MSRHRVQTEPRDTGPDGQRRDRTSNGKSGQEEEGHGHVGLGSRGERVSGQHYHED